MGAGFPIAQLAHAELLSAKPEETVRFFTMRRPSSLSKSSATERLPRLHE